MRTRSEPDDTWETVGHKMEGKIQAAVREGLREE